MTLRTLLAALLLPLLSPGQVVTIPNTTFPAVRSLLNQNFSRLTADITASVKDYGAAGDWNGSSGTDDTTALQAALTDACANGKSLFLPDGSYKITALLTCTVITSKGIKVYGSPNAILVNKGTTNGALKFAGTPHTTTALVLLDGFKILNGTSGTSAFGLQIYGIANPAVSNVFVYGAAGNPTVGIQLSAAQKGYVKGGSVSGAATCILLESAAGINSNAVEISGMDLSCTVSGHTVNGADDGAFHSNHVTSSTYGSHVIASGSGKYTIGPDNHYETIGTNQIYIEGGRVRVIGNSLYDASPAVAVLVSGGSNHTVEDNQINGAVTWSASAFGSRLWGNMIAGTITDSSSSTLWNCFNYVLSGTYLACSSGAGPDPTALFSTTNLGGLSLSAAVDNLGINATSGGSGGHKWGIYSTGGASGAGQGALGFNDNTQTFAWRFILPSDGGVQIVTAAQPTCNVAHRFVINVVAQGAGVKDKVQICAKNSSDVYAWYDLVPSLP